MNLQPLGDRLIVEVLEEEEQTFSGIVLPDTAKEKPQRGRVLAVGPGNRSEQTGDVIPLDVAEGDEVIFSKYGGTEVKVGRRRASHPPRVGRAREGRVHGCQGEGQEGPRRRQGVNESNGGRLKWLTRS